MTRVRALLVAIAAATAFAVAPPAQAVTAGELTLVRDMPSAGAGGVYWNGTLTGNFTGTVQGWTFVHTSVTGSFGYTMPLTTCPLTSTASGVLTIGGTVTLDFNYQHFGVQYVMAMSDGSFSTGTVRSIGGDLPCNGAGPHWIHVTDGVVAGP